MGLYLATLPSPAMLPVEEMVHDMISSNPFNKLLDAINMVPTVLCVILYNNVGARWSAME